MKLYSCSSPNAFKVMSVCGDSIRTLGIWDEDFEDSSYNNTMNLNMETRVGIFAL